MCQISVSENTSGAAREQVQKRKREREFDFTQSENKTANEEVLINVKNENKHSTLHIFIIFI